MITKQQIINKWKANYPNYSDNEFQSAFAQFTSKIAENYGLMVDNKTLDTLQSFFNYCVNYSWRRNSLDKDTLLLSDEAFEIITQSHPNINDIQNLDFKSYENRGKISDNLITNLNKAHSDSGKGVITQILKDIPDNVINSPGAQDLCRHIADVFMRKSAVNGRYYLDDNYQGFKTSILGDPGKVAALTKLCTVFAEMKGSREIDQVNRMIAPVFSQIMHHVAGDKDAAQKIFDHAINTKDNQNKSLLEGILSDPKNLKAEHVAKDIIAAWGARKLEANAKVKSDQVLPNIIKDNADISGRSVKFLSDSAKMYLKTALADYKQQHLYKDVYTASQKVALNRKVDGIQKELNGQQRGGI